MPPALGQGWAPEFAFDPDISRSTLDIVVVILDQMNHMLW